MSRNKHKSNNLLVAVIAVVCTAVLLSAILYYHSDTLFPPTDSSSLASDTSGSASGGGFIGAMTVNGIDLSAVPEYTDTPYFVLCDNIPPVKNLATDKSFETYGELDDLGRCTTCISSVGKELMPTEERGDISSVKPTAWHSVNYDGVGSLYNRCHLIGFQLTGENANKQNLITGTRYMNVKGMLPFENMIADFVKETNMHVIYRVTPVFVGDELLARGVLLEAYSVEDDGDGVCFCVFVYNVQPGIELEYTDGTSYLEGQKPPEMGTYIINKSSKKFHTESCKNAESISEHNKQRYTGSRKDLIDNGYTPCGYCNP